MNTSPSETTPVSSSSPRPSAPGGDLLRRLGKETLVVVGAYAVLGVACAVLWWWLWQPDYFTKAAGGGGGMGEAQLSGQFGADGWYTVVAAVAGAVAGLGLTAWRSRDLLVTTVLVALGSCVAAGVMVVTGYVLGPGDPHAALAGAPTGARVPDQLAVATWVVLLVWPIASLVGSLLVLWSPPEGHGRAGSTAPEPSGEAFPGTEEAR